MKKTLLLIAAAALAATANAQDMSFGVRAGFNMAKVTNVNNTGTQSGSINFNYRPQFGVYANIAFNDLLSFQPEILYMGKGYRHHYEVTVFGINSESNSRVAINYLEVPMQLRINPTENFGLLAGPYLGILLSASSHTKSTTAGTTTESSSSSTSGINTIDFGLNAGAVFQTDGSFNFGARYGMGFSDAFDNSSNNNAHSVIQIIAGYQF